MEAEKGQSFALNVPDELTVNHAWRDEKKPREYNFDGVFDPGSSQDGVFEDTKHLVQVSCCLLDLHQLII
jgi:hypothetical protein